MRSRLLKYLTRFVALLVVLVVALLAIRTYDAHRGPPLEVWHTYVPEELTAEEIDRADWAGYLASETAIFEDLRAEVSRRLDPEDRVPVNRFFEASPIYPANFPRNWNRSYLLEPDGAPVGAVVLLHGLTDSPYSLRHIARRYQAHGFLAVAPRLPAHGTVPAALTEVSWEEWMAVTRLAVREARRRVGPDLPLHIVGFSAGGSLALKHALDSIEDPTLPSADRVILISPMVGITAFAKFAGLAGLPAILPAFAKAAWLSNFPEFNPFKYNSFPINGARQAHQLTRVLQRQVLRLAEGGRLTDLPPIQTFQSVMDFTVSAQAVISALYLHLPDNGSELVLFDLNRNTKLGLLLRPASEAVLSRLLPPPPRRFRTTIITNLEPGGSEVGERVTEAGAVEERVRPLGLVYPIDVFSLSHVALPFPPSDGLYGSDPDPAEDYGVRLGTIAARGETGALIVNLDALLRMSSNPFFSYLIERIEEGLGDAAPGSAIPETQSTAE